MDETKFFTVSEVADKLCRSRPTVYQWLDVGRFPNSFKVGGRGRTTLIPLSDLNAVAREEADKLVLKLAKLGFGCELTTTSNGQS